MIHAPTLRMFQPLFFVVVAVVVIFSDRSSTVHGDGLIITFTETKDTAPDDVSKQTTTGYRIFCYLHFLITSGYTFIL